MKTIKFVSIIFLISLFVFGCQPQYDLDKITSQVKELNDRMETAVLDNDPEPIFDMYTDDAISMPSYQPMTKGLDAIKEMSKDQPQMNMKKFTLTTSEIFVSGDFVVEIGTYDLIIDMGPEMGGEVPDKGKYLTLFEIQKDGGLLIKADTWNTDFNPWEMMMNADKMNDGESN